MKKLFFTLLTSISLFSFAQAPQEISYQGVARSSSGTVLPNQNIGIKLDLHQGSVAGSIVFSENHSKTTNAFGLFTLGIGSSNTSGFTAINWANGPYFLEVSMDPTGGTSYTSVGTQQFMSVPYALYAQTAGNASSTPTITINAPNTVTSAGGSYTINVPASTTYTAGTGIDITGGVISNTATAVTPTITGGNNITVNPSTPSNSYTVSAPTYSLSQSGNNIDLLQNGTSIGTATLPASTSYSAGNGISISGNVISNTLTPVTPSLSVTGNSISINPGNTQSLPNYSLTQSGSNIDLTQNGASIATVTLTAATSTSLSAGSSNILLNQSGNAYTITPVTPTFTNSGPTTITGSYPNYTVNSVISPTTSLVAGNTNIQLIPGTNSYTLNAYTYSLTNNSNTLTLTNGAPSGYTSTVVLPTASTTSLTQGSNVSITGSAPSYTVSSPAYSISLPGGNTVQITNGVSTSTAAINATSLTLTGTNNNILSAGGNTVGLNTYTAGTGVVISGSAPNYTLSSPNQSLTINSNSLSITGGNTVVIPTSTITGLGTGISTVTTSANSFTVNTPSPTYTAASGVLSFGGTNTVVVTPTLSLTGSTLTSGAVTNSVNLSSINNWSVTSGVIYPSTLTNSVGIGTSGPITGKFEILHTATTSNPHINIASPAGSYGRVKFSNTGQGTFFTTEAYNDGSGNNEAYSISHFNGTNTKQVFLINGQRMAYVNALNYPLSTFHVMTSTATAQGGISSEGFAQAGQVNIVRNNNAGAGARSAAFLGDDLGKINFAGYDGAAFGDGAKIYAKAAENVTGSNKGTELIFAAVPTGTNVNKDAFKINGNGNLEVMSGLRIPFGSAAGNILTSDATGNASWQPLAALGAAWTSTLGNTILVNGSDNVGIGTNNPQSSLHVLNSGGSQLRLGNFNQPTREWIWDVNTTSHLSLINEGNGTPKTYMFMDINTGNLGLGTTTPSGSMHLFNNIAANVGAFVEMGSATTTDGVRVVQGGSGNGIFSSIYNSSSSAKAIEAQTSGLGTGISSSQTGSGNAGDFVINNNTNSSIALNVSTNGTGKAINAGATSGYAIYAYNTSAINPALYAENTGTNTTAFFQAGQGSAIYARNTSSTGASVAELASNGNGIALQVYKNTGATGSVASFANFASGNGSDAVTISNTGAASSLYVAKPSGSTSGNAVRVENLSNSNAADVLFVNNGGTGAGAAVHAVVSNTNTGTAGLFDGNVITNGNVTIPATKNYKYATPKTDYNSISALSFNTEGTYNRANLSGGIYIIDGSAGTQGNLYSGVNLPNGAVVTGLDAYVLDNDGVAGHDIAYVQLWRQDGAVGSSFGNAVNMAQTPGTSITSSAVVKLSTTTISNSTIDNSLYTYYVRVGSVQAAPNLMLFKVVITYTITNVD